MNLPNDPNKNDIPEEAKGNPVYEQTRQDMPLFCCGRNCGRNSRIVVMVMGIIGIACSTWFCLSSKYFSFVALRNDTFYDEDKLQPDPFRYATEANVGVFRYEILEVYEYPWPPPKQERMLREDGSYYQEEDEQQNSNHNNNYEVNEFEEALLREIRRLQGENNTTVLDEFSNSTEFPSMPDNSTIPPLLNQTVAPTAPETPAPSPGATPVSTDAGAPTLPPNIPIGPGSNEDSHTPTENPTPAPTITNPNDIVAMETEPLNTKKPYPLGMKQFEGDSVMTNGQRGALWAPIFAGIGLVFCSIELFCCVYKCSWLPTALFLYLAFMFQTFTLFMFLSEDFCKYAQDCKLGYAGFLTMIAIFCYMLAQSLVCCTPRPTPLFNCCKKPPTRRKKKKKRRKNDDDEENPERDGLTRDYDYDGDDNFEDEPNRNRDYYDDGGDGYVDPYAEEDEFTNFEDQSYQPSNQTSTEEDPEETVDSDDIYSTNRSYRDYDNDDDGYGRGKDNDTYAQDNDTYEQEDSYTEANDTYAQDNDTYAQDTDTYAQDTDTYAQDTETYAQDSNYTDGDGESSYQDGDGSSEYTDDDDDDQTNEASQYTDNDTTEGGGTHSRSGENDSGWSTGEGSSRYT